MMDTEEDDEIVLGMGWVYLMEAGNLIKIGTTRKHPTWRAPELTRRTRIGHRVLWAIKVEDAKRAERDAHERCAASHVYGEYFQISYADAMDAVVAVIATELWPSEEFFASDRK